MVEEEGVGEMAAAAAVVVVVVVVATQTRVVDSVEVRKGEASDGLYKGRWQKAVEGFGGQGGLTDQGASVSKAKQNRTSDDNEANGQMLGWCFYFFLFFFLRKDFFLNQ